MSVYQRVSKIWQTSDIPYKVSKISYTNLFQLEDRNSGLEFGQTHGRSFGKHICQMPQLEVKRRIGDEELYP